MANADKLTDDELRQELVTHGQDVGLISDATRHVWVKKLLKLRADKKQTKVAPISKKLIGFSSDESDDNAAEREQKPQKPASKKGRSTKSSSTTAKRRQSKTTNSSLPSNSNGNDSYNFKTPANIDSTRATRKSGNAVTSDFAIDSDQSLKSTKPKSRYSHDDILSLPKVPSDNFDSTDADDTDIDDIARSPPIMFTAETNTSPYLDRTFPSPPPPSKSLSNHCNDRENERGWLSNDESGNYTPPSISARATLRNTRDWLKSDIAPARQRLISGRRSYQNHHDSLMPRKALLSDEEKIRECGFKVSEEDSSTSYSQYFSLVLVVIVALFFVLLGAAYYLKWSHGGVLSGIVQKPVNKSPEFYAAVLMDHLSQLKGSAECGYLDDAKLSKLHARRFLESSYAFDSKSNGGEDWDLVLKKIKDGAKYIRLTDKDELQVTKLDEIRFLEWDSDVRPPHRSLMCRLKKSMKKVLTGVLIFIAFIFVVATVYAIVRYRQFVKEKEKQKVYNLVERIIDLLKQQYEDSLEKKEISAYVPIPHARDVLIPMQDRQKMMGLWEKAVHFLDANESRVRIDIQTIDGEEYECWKWLHAGPTAGRRVWQGQAFGEHADNSNAIPYSPTPCLKVRSMFDQEMEYGEDWHIYIQDAILEKCFPTCPDGIVHIAVDKNSNEGCVYIKCSSCEAAGRCFKSLHGWWFDRQLVTVKFLRLERYHQRFPHAVDLTMPLRPSNDECQSMSEPFHRSALECS
ncbi:inner nuclear membrane protein Man1-like [Tubulanus polymorphus]|uniref:inner nuclear membrane protein Man1-like n=1 Tax=Tubulanus polymorphus TaxID=672921 RepID=UPI003DA4722A